MNPTESWKSFLPRRALVMARPRAGARPAPAAAPEATALTPAASSPSSNPTLESVAADLEGCRRCRLCEGRKTIVLGEGNPRARLVFVGEGPGEQEDEQGRPFVGKAGQLLDRMIEAMGLKREDVHILNVVKCRPPGNRNPEPDEIASCSPFLYRQLEAIQPEVIVALGKFAAQTLLKTDTGITRLRGSFQELSGVKVMPTFHPAYLLRNPASKRECWDDLKKVAEALGLSIPAKS